MEKKYNHKEKEKNIYKMWEKTGAFSPDNSSNKPPFTIIMPPPNANDPLHVGHVRYIAIQDILIRFYRMRGFPTLWLPGADHAGIETQYVFEKKLSEKNKSRFDYTRKNLFEMIQDYTEKHKGIMENQLKLLGASCDWSRFKYTLDPEIIDVVYKTFKHLYDDGLIYRGERLVNYCSRCGTSFSQLEVNHIEKESLMYHLDYGTLTIATTRPETIFADVAIAVYPDDKRYKKLIGKTATIPLIGKEIPIIADELVDPKFGTGALKITPGHDPTDFEIGKKHDLPVISVINKKGKMTNVPKKYDGLDVKKARHAVEKDLEEGGFLKKKKKISHTVGVCYRDKGIIEPLVTKQWYLKVDPLVKKSVKAIKEKRIKFAAQHFKKIALHWYKNLHDWNISRQIVWGIRIPAWKCKECNKWVVTDGATPNNCPHCNGEKLVQDTDTFDTWFSSGQWPYATLMTTKKGDYKRFYPTSVMETGYDILPFWVIRMIMLGLYEKDEAPFKTVLLHGLVRDENGEKISKSKGNVIDPVKMIEKYGADALRMGIIWGSLVENDISLSEDNIKAQRNFANKIWNVARFVFMEDTNLQSTNKNKDDKDILNELKKTVALVTKLTNDYRLNEAAEELYNFIWNKFANEYLEKTKSRRKDAQPTLEHVLQESLKLLHPFMPFVTEAIWQEGKSRFDSPTLIKAKWPSH